LTPACHFCDRLARLGELPAGELVWQFPHSVALLGPWQYYHGYCVLVARAHAAELHRLPDDDRRGVFDELCLLARAVEAGFRPRKLNCELLGNQVPHPHWHLFPRYESDPNRLQAVWLDIARAESDPAERRRLSTGPIHRAETAALIRRHLESQMRDDATA
jgi:diadenosine tetraphosphate (Ap4A) HIT family hydrolase